jgi:hypothetical protein
MADYCYGASGTMLGRVRFMTISGRRRIYFAAVAVNKERIVFLVKSEGHDVVHDVLWNVDFLCTWHVDDFVDNSIVRHEEFKCWIQVFLDKRTGQN